jgi:putative membrane protein
MMMGWIIIIPLLLVGVIVLVLSWRPERWTGDSQQNRQTPLDILKNRYANGEITRQEYEEMRKDLGS